MNESRDERAAGLWISERRRVAWSGSEPLEAFLAKAPDERGLVERLLDPKPFQIVRGDGEPATESEIRRALNPTPIFLSFSRSNEAAASLIMARLERDFARRVFVAEKDVRAGSDFRNTIAEAIRNASVFLAVLGPGWQQSEYQRYELELALAIRRERGLRIIPLLLDDARMPQPSEIPASLRELSDMHALYIRSGGDDEPSIGELVRVLRRSSYSAIPPAKLSRLSFFDRLLGIGPLELPDATATEEGEAIRIFYATDRQRSGRSEPAAFFENERAAQKEVTLGTCLVSVPTSDRHRVGRLERASIFRLEFRQDPKKHVCLLSVETKAQSEFYGEMRTRVQGSERREAFVFVHGYNVTFEDAVLRAAQFAFDLHFDGAPILYSWPSRGRWWKYAADEVNVGWSSPQLEAFLGAIASQSGAHTVHLIAHSMGNRVLTSALDSLVKRRAFPAGLFRQIVLTAPDVDSETFQYLAEAIAKEAQGVTMYSNYRDRALLVSKLFHLYRRAGATIIIVKGMDTIDASRVDTSLTRHSYFGSSRTVLADLSALLIDGKPPGKRFGMRELATDRGPYYVFRP